MTTLQLQQALNHLFYSMECWVSYNAHGTPRAYHVPEDGLPGPVTARAVRKAKLCIGYADKYANYTADRLFIARLKRPLDRGIPAFVTQRMVDRGKAYREAMRAHAKTGTGYVFPLPDLDYLQRVDRGQDMQAHHSHAPFIAMGNAVVRDGSNSFPGVVIELLDGPERGLGIFHGHTFESHVSAGERVHAGQELGTVGHTSASWDGDDKHIEIGKYPWSDFVAPGTHHTETGAEFHAILHRYWPDKVPAQQIIG